MLIIVEGARMRADGQRQMGMHFFLNQKKSACLMCRYMLLYTGIKVNDQLWSSTQEAEEVPLLRA